MVIMHLSNDQLISFQKFIWNFYAEHGRTFAWRNINDSYAVLISEVMLQQTQTHRVAPKYELWMTELPNFQSLAQASVATVYSLWKGLGYNRRALYLQKTAQRVMDEFKGVLPEDPGILQTFDGIGPNTAGSVCAFAFNKPVVFIETNIRTVFIHGFFKDKEKISDKELLPLIAATVDHNNAREWYYALMDYGVFLKSQLPNPSRKSAHHAKQSKFEGSFRQIRGGILKLLDAQGMVTITHLPALINRDMCEIEKAIDQLIVEGFIIKKDLHIQMVDC